MNLKLTLMFLDCSVFVNILNGDSLDVDTASLPFVDRLRLFCGQNDLFVCWISHNCNMLAHCATNYARPYLVQYNEGTLCLP